MRKTFSVYEAKARFSELMRLVREEGATIEVSYHGRPVAEIRPIEPTGNALEERLERLEAAGALQRAHAGDRSFLPIATKRGALARFLAERR